MLRIADLDHLARRLGELGLCVRARYSTEFWNVNRFPRGLIRTGTIEFNRAWFALDPAPSWSVGNAVVAEKHHRRPPMSWAHLG